MDAEISKDVRSVTSFGRSESVISAAILFAALVATVADLVFHLAGGFLAVFALGLFLPSLLGCISGLLTMRLKPSGRILNFVLAGILIWYGLPPIVYHLIMSLQGKSVYPPWIMAVNMLSLIIALFLCYFFTRRTVRGQFSKKSAQGSTGI